MRWWWVRHAPSVGHGFFGWSDPPADLSAARRLDALAASLPQAPVLCSDLARARMTAARIADGRPRLPEDPALREINFGAWEGLAFDRIAARDPDLSRAFFSDPGPVAAPLGESYDDLAARVGGAIETRLGMGGDLIVVAHAGVIAVALARAAGIAPARALAFRIAPLSLTRLDWLADAQAWTVDRVNAAPTGD